jgi:LysM repeat protein
MRTKTIARWRRAALGGALSIGLAAGAQQAPAPQAEAQASPEAPAAGAPAQERAAEPAASDGRGTIAVPEGTPQEYTIQKGDTLWDLSQKFLSNPWYWPKIWSLNPGIENPHWIYPGAKLKVLQGQGGPQSPAQVQGEAPGDAADAQAQAEAGGEELPATPGAGSADLEVVSKNSRESRASRNSVSVSGKLAFTPPPVVSVRASGLVSPDELAAAGSLAASFEERQMLTTYDTAYVTFKDAGTMKPGDKLVFFRPDGPIVHPVTHRKIADKTKTVGVAKVLLVNGNLATVQVERVLEEIERGDLARPWTPQDKRIAPRANKSEVQGVIVSGTNPGLTTFGEANEVFIDKGTADGVEEGNTFAVIRKGDGLNNVLVTGTATQGSEGRSAALVKTPDENVALLLVIDAKEHLSTAVVVKSNRELEAGDAVLMRASGAGGP